MARLYPTGYNPQARAAAYLHAPSRTARSTRLWKVWRVGLSLEGSRSDRSCYSAQDGQALAVCRGHARTAISQIATSRARSTQIRALYEWSVFRPEFAQCVQVGCFRFAIRSGPGAGTANDTLWRGAVSVAANADRGAEAFVLRGWLFQLQTAKAGRGLKQPRPAFELPDRSSPHYREEGEVSSLPSWLVRA